MKILILETQRISHTIRIYGNTGEGGLYWYEIWPKDSRRPTWSNGTYDSIEETIANAESVLNQA